MFRLIRPAALSVMVLALASCTGSSPTSLSSESASASTSAVNPSTSTSASSGTSSAKGDSDGVLTLALGHEHADSFNPLAGWAPNGYSKIYDGLVAHDNALTIKPALASKLPEVSSDGKTITVTLREGVTFHDGSTFGPEDVVETYKAILDPKSASDASGRFGMLDRVEAKGNTVAFSLKQPYFPFPHLLDQSIVPSEMAKPGTPVTELELNQKPIGTGPFKVESQRDKADVTLVPNDKYWGTKPSLKKVTLVNVEEEANLVQRIETGEIDGANLPARIADELVKKHDDLEIIAMPSSDFRGIILPMNHPVSGDKAIRQAMNIATNRQAIIDRLMTNRATPAITMFPPGYKPWTDETIKPEFDVEKANKILDDAGWKKGEGGIREKNGQKATFTLMFSASSTDRRDLALAFVQDMKAIGVEVKPEGLGWDAIKPRMGSDAVMFGGGDPFDPDLQAFELLHSSVAGDGWNNPGHYKNAKIDELLKAGRETNDEQERIKAYHGIQKELVEDPNGIFIAFADSIYVQRKGYSGYKEMLVPHVQGVTAGPWWNLEEWTTE